MSIIRWGFEVGINNDALSSTNTNSDYVIATSGSASISTSQSFNGTRSARFTGNSTSGGLYFQQTVTTTTTLGVDLYLRIVSYPSADSGIIWVGNGGTRSLSVTLNSSGLLQLRDGSGSGGSVIWASSQALPIGTWLRISLFGSQHATTGQTRLAYYNENGTTPIGDSSLLTGRNTGAAAYSTVRIGAKVSTSTATIDTFIDDWAYDVEATGLLPPQSSAVPIIQNVTTAQTVFIDMSYTTFAQGPGSFSASPTTNTIPTSTGVVVPLPTSNNSVIYTVTATDTGNGLSSTSQVTVTNTASGAQEQGHSESVIWSGSTWV